MRLHRPQAYRYEISPAGRTPRIGLNQSLRMAGDRRGRCCWALGVLLEVGAGDMIRRVPADPDEHGCPYLVGGIYQKKLRGVEGRSTFRVTTLPELQRLGDVTRADVLAEGGFSGTRALMAWKLDWVRRHDRWSKTHPQVSDAEVLVRWRMRHADRYCWVLVIALVERPRLLAPQRDILAEVARRGLAIQDGQPLSDGDEYTSGQTIDREAEAVDEATLNRIVAGEMRGRAEPRLTVREKRRLRERRFFGGEP